MTKEEKAVYMALTGALNVIEALYGYPWKITDKHIFSTYYKMNDLCIELSGRGKEDEADD